MRNFFWSDSNAKLNKTAEVWEERFGRPAKIVSFNIPQLKSETGQRTCPYAGMCADICYADQGRLSMPMAKLPRERNLEHINKLSKAKLRDALIADVENMRKVTHIRLHDSGDFFKRSYYQAWVEVAERCPDLTFYAYTKSIPFLEWDSHPKNFRIVQSVGGKRDHDIDMSRPHSRIFASDEDRKRAKYCDGNKSDIPAILGQKRIGLVYHGTRNLTEDNLIKLRVD